MQSAVPSRKPVEPRPPKRPQPPGGWTISIFTAAVFAIVLGMMIAIPALFVFKDHLPERVQYIPYYVEAQIKKRIPHPVYVPTPSVVNGAAKPPVLTLDLEEETPLVEALAAAPEAQPTVVILAQAEAPLEVPLPDKSEAMRADLTTTRTDDAEVAEAASQVEEVDEPAPVAEEAPNTVTLAAPEAEPTPSVAIAATLPSTLLQGVRHEYQKMNNCGPVTIAMQLSYFGRPETQFESAPILKPQKTDKNVGPDEMAAYARSIGFESFVGVGGDLPLLKKLVSNGFPVIVESWFIPEPDDEMGHYLLLIGYDDATGELLFNDSYHGPEQRVDAAEFDQLWQVFNRTFVLSYPPERSRLAHAILGKRAEPEAMYTHALRVAHQEATADPTNRYAWFNIGSSLVGLGDMGQAAQAFDHARTLKLPWRMLWYQFGPFEAYYAVGRYQDVIDLATANLKAAGDHEESYYWRGRAYQALGDMASARRDFERALQANVHFAPAAEALAALPS